MRILLFISRFLVGILFIISGLIKANDTIGFSYKLGEYFEVFGMEWLTAFALLIAASICIFEIILGVMLLIGSRIKFTTWSLFLMIVFFTYFYTAIAFDPVQVSTTMKQQGGFIPGVRPGKKTAEFIDNILTRVTLPGSFSLAFIAIFPYILMQIMDIDFNLASFFGGTSLLIIVGVGLDTIQQIESHLMMRHYDGFLSKGRIRGRRRM